MVDEASEVAIASSVNNCVTIDAEHITTADTDSLVALLPEVGDRLTHDLTHILNHHFSLGDRLQSKQAPVMDTALRKLQLLLPKLQHSREIFVTKTEIIALHSRSTKTRQFVNWIDWIEQCFTSPPTQYRLYGRRFVKQKRYKNENLLTQNNSF